MDDLNLIHENSMIKSKHAEKLKSMIAKAIEDNVLTRDEYDLILHLASEDGHIDSHEQALLEELHDMIENKTIKIKAK
jgi:hypothetical protein